MFKLWCERGISLIAFPKIELIVFGTWSNICLSIRKQQALSSLYHKNSQEFLKSQDDYGFSFHSKWSEPRSISSSYCVIVLVRLLLRRIVLGDWRFDNLSETLFFVMISNNRYFHDCNSVLFNSATYQLGG